MVLFGWLAVFYTVPEGIAAPYAAGLGGGPAATGLVLASTAFATMIGTPLFTRFVRPRARASLMGPLAVLTCAALVLTALRPDLAVSLVIFSLSALFGIYQIAANTEFVARVPDERRAQAVGIASTGIVVGQGAGFIAAGAAASFLGPAVVIALWGGAGAVAAVALTLRWRQSVTTWRPPCRRTARCPRRDEGAGPARPACRPGRVSYFMALFGDTV